jgi:hypothetical protein
VQLIHLMLREIADAQFGRPGDLAAIGGKLARQQFRQRRFAFAVAAQQRDAVVLIDPQRQVFSTGGPP